MGDEPSCPNQFHAKKAGQTSPALWFFGGALGSLQERTETLALLDLLPQVRMAQLSEVRLMIEARRLYSLGIGLTDAHLIASVFINSPTLLWTRDKPLRKAAEGLGIHASLA
jgi:predicted nucleic acid-binding protein